MDALIGKRLGQYEILSKLGSGGMASVYRARQTSIERDVALKVIRTDLTEDAAFTERFAREARTIASLSHLHVLKVFDYGQQDGIAYLVMELLEGGSLSMLIQRNGALSLTAAGRILIQIAGALDYAHGKGIVHRDLKSDNVLLDGAENAYLTDFGIARLINDTSKMTQTGTIMGTPAYMAPELWTGQPADKQADIYAMGVILYEMITGKTPFGGDTPYVIMYQHLNELPPLERLEPSIPPAVQSVLLQAMAKKPEDRFISANALASAYDAACGGVHDTRHGVPVKSSPVIDMDDDLPTELLNLPPTEASKKTVVEKPTTVTTLMTPTSSPKRTMLTPLAGIAMVVILLAMGGLAFSQAQQQAAASATQFAMHATQTDAAKPTETATPSATPTISPTPTPTPTVEETEVAFDSLLFSTYTNEGLNIAFRYPQEWDVELVQGKAIFVTEDFSKLDLSDPTKGITGGPYIQIIAGSAEELGALNMKTAETPEDALVAFLGLDRVTNLDPVEGTRFPTATTRRARPDLGVVRHVYVSILGPNRFAIALLQTGPRASTVYNNNVMLPLVRSLDNYVQITPTLVATATPAPTVIFPTPFGFTTETVEAIGLQFVYPTGWSMIADEQSASIMPLQNAQQLGDYAFDDFNRPYNIFMRFDGKGFISVLGEVGIETIFADNYGSFTVNPIQLYDAPYPTVYAQTADRPVYGIAVRGWVALIKLREDLYISIFAHAGSGREAVFRDTVLLPIIYEMVDVNADPNAAGNSPTALPAGQVIN